MPIQSCSKDGRPGYQYGDNGACYTYKSGDKESKLAAKKLAIKQGVAIEKGRGGTFHASISEKIFETIADAMCQEDNSSV